MFFYQPPLLLRRNMARLSAGCLLLIILGMVDPFLGYFSPCLLDFDWHTGQPPLRATLNPQRISQPVFFSLCFPSRPQWACTFSGFLIYSPVHLGFLSTLASRLICVTTHWHGCMLHFVLSSFSPPFVPPGLDSSLQWRSIGTLGNTLS